MLKSLSGRDMLGIFASYAHTQLGVIARIGHGVSKFGTLALVDFSHLCAVGVDFGGPNLSYESPSRVTPVLYALEDLPKLSARMRDSGGTPLQELVHRMYFHAVEDVGAGEYISAVTVLKSSEHRLHLAVATGYTPAYGPGDDVSDNFEEGYYQGANYEVIIEALGNVHWRNVTADELHGGPQWRVLDGHRVMMVFAYLVELHVAVGVLASVGLAPGHYVRKAAPLQEGGPADA